jgi:hypothetical protein
MILDRVLAAGVAFSLASMPAAVASAQVARADHQAVQCGAVKCLLRPSAQQIHRRLREESGRVLFPKRARQYARSLQTHPGWLRVTLNLSRRQTRTEPATVARSQGSRRWPARVRLSTNAECDRSYVPAVSVALDREH